MFLITLQSFSTPGGENQPNAIFSIMGIIRYGKHGIAVLLFMLKLLDWFSVRVVQ